jgi:predicted PolB exonuclease-like 3'-5' exonuclease
LPTHLLVLDIETIPDTTVLPYLTGHTASDPEEGRAQLAAYHLGITNGRNAFPRQLFHRVIALHALEVPFAAPHRPIRMHRLGGGTMTEETIVRTFFNQLGPTLPRLVTFGGRGFDLPVLRYRALKYGIAAPWLYRNGNRWDQYVGRYGMTWHYDLLEWWSDHGVSARVRLQELCALCALPGKHQGSAEQVWTWYQAQQHDAIAAYCDGDVWNTYLLYLATLRHNGMLSAQEAPALYAQFRAYLAQEAVQRPHACMFEAACTPES